MSTPQLSSSQAAMLVQVFHHHPEITRVVLFGSRAKGNAKDNSDIDLAVAGCTSTLQIEALAEDLDQLPLPFQFDVQALETVHNAQLAEHIQRVGVEIYRSGK